MQLTSPAFKNLDFIPARYTCDGENISPPLILQDIPEDTKSLVLIVDDPDAPGGDWVHWLVWNLNPTTIEIASHSLPPFAIQGLNDFGHTTWVGPCPPSGIHRYQFTLYALDTTLDLAYTTTKPKLLAALQAHIIETSMLVGLYKRP